MEYSLMFRLIWIWHIITIFTVVTAKNVTSSPFCSCRSIDECLNEVLSNLRNTEFFAFFSPCEYSNKTMIKCCTSLHISMSDFSVHILQKALMEQTKHALHDMSANLNKNSIEQVERYSLMMKELLSGILPPFVNFVYPEHTRASDATNSKITEFKNSEEFDADTLEDIRHNTFIMKDNHAEDIIMDDFETVQLNNITTLKPTTPTMDYLLEEVTPLGFPYPEHVKTNGHSLFASAEDSTEYVRSKRQKSYKHKKYSPHIQQLINEIISLKNIKMYLTNQSSKHLFLNNVKNLQAKILNQLMSATNTEKIDDDKRLNSIIDNYEIMKKSSEFGESAVNTRYEEQSMVSSTPKDFPTTINSFEQKTPSETYLSPDRISTQPINKNTPTTNKSEAPKTNTIFTIVKNLPFSENAQNITQNITRSVVHYVNSQFIRNVQNKPRERTNDSHRDFLHIENAKEITLVPRWKDPLQVLTRNKRMTEPISPTTSQKNILNKNTEEAEYKNNTTQKENTKENTKLSLQDNQSEQKIKEEGKESKEGKSKNAKEDVVEETTVTILVKKFRFPPKDLAAKLVLFQKDRNSMNTSRSKYFVQLSSDRFRHFYEARKDILLKLNNTLNSNRIKSSVNLLSNASQVFLSKLKKELAIKQNLTLKNALNINKSNVSALNDSIDINKNNSSVSHASVLNLQNATLISEENTIQSNISISSQENEKSMQMKDKNSSTEHLLPLILENLKELNKPSKVIKQEVADGSKQLLESEINENRTHKEINTRSPIDNQSSQNETQTTRPSELSSIPQAPSTASE